MKIGDFILLAILILVLIFGIYLVFINLPKEKVQFKEFERTDYSEKLPYSSQQFYPNMRFKDSKISYTIDDSCSEKRKTDAFRAFNIISGKTVLEFYINNEDPEIIVTCANLVPDNADPVHFIAGEGGPTEVVNSSQFNVISSGKLSLFRTDKCAEPKIALHEILHVLGFNHNSNNRSIMYPETSCDQELDPSIIQDIDDIYRVPGNPDLSIEKATASSVGRFIDFEITVGNVGLEDSKKSILWVVSDGKREKNFTIEAMEIGTKRIITVQNMMLDRKVDKLDFEVESFEEELSLDNNVASVEIQ